MRKLILAALFFASSVLIAIHAEQRADSTSTGKNGKWHMELPFTAKNKNHVRNVTMMRGIYGGWLFNYHGKTGIENKSEWGVLEVMGINLNPFGTGTQFSLGVGFGVRIYDTKPGYMFCGDLYGNLHREYSAEENKIDKSRLTSWTFQVPALWRQKIYRRLIFSAGAIMNFNTYATATSRYEENGVRFTERYKGLHQQFFTVDLIGMLGINEGIAFYCRWSPMPLFKNPEGPEFRTVAIGFALHY